MAGQRKSDRKKIRFISQHVNGSQYQHFEVSKNMTNKLLDCQHEEWVLTLFGTPKEIAQYVAVFKSVVTLLNLRIGSSMIRYSYGHFDVVLDEKKEESYTFLSLTPLFKYTVSMAAVWNKLTSHISTWFGDEKRNSVSGGQVSGQVAPFQCSTRRIFGWFDLPKAAKICTKYKCIMSRQNKQFKKTLITKKIPL
uniref:Uncharacterized protein n=1 Tax=Ditylenchus dipsaci TaxID=166011 RepID=A0A915EIJ9_9BILA